ncbi:MAG TPA: hypothetical protein ENG54_02855 [Thermofilum sp.]|nr:hypothetical protein [Thermofilum sp.]
MIRVVCSNCGYVFYQGEELKSIWDVVKKKLHNGRCPKCLRRIDLSDFSSISVEVRVRSRRNP